MHDLRTWNAWRDVHQPFELGWWKEHLAQLESPGFEEQWAPVREFIEPHGLIIDIGCGPRPPFRGVVIDPLADEYRKLVPSEWWQDVMAFAQQAEIQIFHLLGKADTVICWNCLDHTIGWRDILDNMLAYGRKGAAFAIATDFFEPFIGHPGYDRDEFMSEIEKRFRVIDKREPFGRQLALLLAGRL